MKPFFSGSAKRRIQRIHFVGIGGAGMGGIAEVLQTMGFAISGSDLRISAMTERLSSIGVKVSLGHDSEAVRNVDVVVISSAIPEDNPEIKAAREKRIPVVRRAEMLAELMRFRYGVAVAGTHGKTTTTSLIASVLAEGGLDPTFIIGGRLNSTATHAQLGESSFLVAEADESDASFLLLQPMISVVTNIDADHLETYHGDYSELEKVFMEFVHHLPFYGLAIVCADDPGLQRILTKIRRPILTYGLSETADIRAESIIQDGLSTAFTVRTREESFPVRLNLPGEHNVRNALAAIAVGLELGADKNAIAKALDEFQGIGRRFQVYGPVSIATGSITLIDDYGHHPTEMAATLAAARKAWPDRRLVVAFQPHRFTRTRDLFDDFASVLSTVDGLVLLDVYSAGESPIAGADGRSLARAVRLRNRVEPVFVENLEDLPTVLMDILEDGDILLTLGAGSIGRVAEGLPDLLGRAP